MDFLSTPYSLEGYPMIVFYAIGLAGFLLVFFRPYWAFLFTVFCLAARNFHAAVFTRPPLLGPYCNLNDLLMWISLLALARWAIQEEDLWAPKVLVAILVINYLGAMQSFFQYGFIADVERPLWATAIFPVMFLVAANFINSHEKARHFYWALFIGALLAAAQHLYFVKYQLAALLSSISESNTKYSIS